MSVHYFKLTKHNAYINTTSKFETHTEAQNYIDNFDSDFTIGHVITLIHDVVDHINGQRYIGGIADEVMALAANKTMNMTTYSNFIEDLVDQLAMLNQYVYDWGDLPIAIQNQLKVTTLPRSKYKKIFKTYFPNIYNFDKFYQTVKTIIQHPFNDYECDATILEIKNIQILRKLVYLGMVKTLKKYSLDFPITGAPVRDTMKYCLSSVCASGYSLPTCDYLKIVIDKYQVKIFFKYSLKESWILVAEENYRFD